MCDDDFIDLRCLLRGCHHAPTYRYKILYVGTDLALSKSLRDALTARDCFIDYCPAAWLAHVLLKSDIYYLLVVFDSPGDATGAEFMQFTRALPHRAQTPIAMLVATDAAATAQAGAHVRVIEAEHVERLGEMVRQLIEATEQRLAQWRELTR